MSTEPESGAMTCLDAPSLDVAQERPVVESEKRCRSGHPLKTYASGYVRCPVCVAATGKRWRAKSPGYPRAWRQENKERWTEMQRRWREAHREEIRSYHAVWRAANRDRMREYQRRYLDRLRAQA